jgi:thioredoxin-related protein
MAKKILTLIFISGFIITGLSQTTKRTPNYEPEESLINWMPLDSALAKQKKAPKKILIDIYTDWCGWCKHMAKTTFSNKQIAAYINQNYYPVRFNGETTDTMIYLGDTLVNTNTGRRGAHQLTMILTNKRPSYPTLSYLDERGHLISPVPGYKSVNDIEPFLVFFTENVFRTSDFNSFQENFRKTFTDSLNYLKHLQKI